MAANRGASTMQATSLKHLKPLLRSDTPTPLYHQLFGLLRERIVGGEIPRGQRLPTEFELADAFEVSRITAKRALDELAAAGLVRRQRGRGTFVTHSARVRPLKAPLVGLMEGLEVIARETQVQVLAFERVEPPPVIRELFGLPAGATLARALRVRRRQGQPFGHYESYSAIDDPRFDGAALSQSSRIELFQRLGIRFARVEQTLSAAAAVASVAARLRVDPGAPLLTLERRSYGEDGRLFDLLLVHYRPDRFRYHMTLAPDDPP